MSRETTQVVFPTISIESADLAEPSRAVTKTDTQCLFMFSDGSLSYSVYAETGMRDCSSTLSPLTQRGRSWRTLAVFQSLALLFLFLYLCSL